MTANWYGISFGNEENIVGLDTSNVTEPWEDTKKLLNCTIQNYEFCTMQIMSQ